MVRSSFPAQAPAQTTHLSAVKLRPSTSKRTSTLSRVVPASIIAKLGTPHVKGMLLRAC